MPPLLSVLITTRNRPELFGEALRSVLAQRGDAFEVIVVDDGSDDVHRDGYAAHLGPAEQAMGQRLKVLRLPRRARGHGQSYAINSGVELAAGRYVTFLDDDDRWTDDAHLSRVGAAVLRQEAAGQPLDLYMANQEAWRVDGTRVGVLWLGGLAEQLQAAGRQLDDQGLLSVGVTDLLGAGGFCHVNVLTVRRALYLQVGGMDEGVRWECDRDLYLKLIDAAGHIVLDPRVVSWHRVPDPAKTGNMTTALGMPDKRLLQALVMDKTLIRARHPAIRAHARAHKAYALDHLGAEFAARRDWSSALFVAGQALGARPSPARAAQWLQLLGKRCLSGPGSAG